MPRGREGWAVALPAALLCSVAVAQLWLAHARQLTAWCGGGFGMFSTVDGWRARHLHIVLRGPGWRRESAVPPELRELADRVRALPDARRIRALASEMLTDHAGASAIEVSVFARDFDPETLQPAGRLFVRLEVERDAQ
jgi:hypothetical protein